MEQRRVTRKTTRESGGQLPDFPTTISASEALEYSIGNWTKVRKIQDQCNSDQKISIGKTQIFKLGDLPDELILKMFSYLSVKDLMNCGQVSERIRAISHDETLWQKVNLYRLKVSTEFLQMILNNGCKHLSLKRSDLVGNLCHGNTSQLKYLDLDNCSDLGCRSYPGVKVQEDLLASCYSLEILSLAHQPITSEIVRNICYQNGKTLQILDLCGSDVFSRGQFNVDVMKQIICNCTELRELDLSFVPIPPDTLDFLAKNLTPKIKRLNLYYQRDLKDEHVNALVRRCNKITDLNLDGTTISKVSLMSIIGNLKHTLEKLRLPGWQNIHHKSLIQLRSLARLRILDCDLTCDCCGFKSLRKQLPHVSITNSRDGRVKELQHHFIGAIAEFSHPHCRCLKCLERNRF